MNDHVNPILAAALAPFTPPCAECGEPRGCHLYNCSRLTAADYKVRGDCLGSLVIDCPACYGGWRDNGDTTVRCIQCNGTGRVATNGGEA